MRSIPAWAGNPLAFGQMHVDVKVYPRVGGEPYTGVGPTHNDGGLSPRGRGTPFLVRGFRYCTGSIPAWAGNPLEAASTSKIGWVYPRVGGEPVGMHSKARYAPGLSPRGRGTPGRLRRSRSAARSIPAWAGNPSSGAAPRRPLWVYPRVGGEPDRPAPLSNVLEGLSPRGRGTRLVRGQRRVLRRSIPAWAGNPTGGPAPAPAQRVYPRVGGEPVYALRSVAGEQGLSPRGRGTPCQCAPMPLSGRSIPAWAGNPRFLTRHPAKQRVYPRVGGEPGH